MAEQEHLNIFNQGVDSWNEWRAANPLIEPNLSDANLSGAILYAANLSKANLAGAYLGKAGLERANLSGTNLSRSTLDDANLTGANLSGTNLSRAVLMHALLGDANFSGANLSRAILFEAILIRANLSGANLSCANLINSVLCGANLSRANLAGANLSGSNLISADLSEANLNKANLDRVELLRAKLEHANLRGANLNEANLREANARDANLGGANLIGANLVQTDFAHAHLAGARVYGVSAWNINLEAADQSDLIITREDEPTITVDHLEIAQFIYLLLKNEKIRDVINTIGRKAVLILGRFSDTERKSVLEAMRAELRRFNYVPIVFDFERPTERDFTETIMTLAGMCLFIIADITNPKSSPLELQATVPNYMIPFVPIIQKDEHPFAMFVNLQTKFKWVLPLVKYSSRQVLVNAFEAAVIEPALRKRDELISEKAKEVAAIDADELRNNKTESSVP